MSVVSDVAQRCEWTRIRRRGCPTYSLGTSQLPGTNHETQASGVKYAYFVHCTYFNDQEQEQAVVVQSQPEHNLNLSSANWWRWDRDGGSMGNVAEVPNQPVQASGESLPLHLQAFFIQNFLVSLLHLAFSHSIYLYLCLHLSTYLL